MADTEKKISELTSAAQVNDTDLTVLSQGSAGSGFSSVKATLLAIAQKIVTGINFTSNLHTTDKTVTGAINEVAADGNIAEPYDDTSTYAVGDYCIYQTTLYKCITAVSTAGAWDSTKWDAVLVTDEMGSSGSGGHTILNDSGTSLAQEDDLQFKGVYVHDDSINGKTVVENYREMTAAEYALLNAEQKKGLINVTDEHGHPITASATGFDNTGTSYSSTNVDGVLKELDTEAITPTINTTYIDDTSQNTIIEVNRVGKLVILNISGLALKSALSGSPVLLSNLPKPKNTINIGLTNFLSGGASTDGWNVSRYHINTNGELQLWYDAVPQNSIPFGLIIYVAD